MGGLIGKAFETVTDFLEVFEDIPIVGDVLEFVIGDVEADSPTYAHPNQIGNTISEDVPIARCYGRCKIGGNKIRFNEPDASDLRVIFAHCLGEVNGITEWKVNNIAWADLTGSHTKTEYKGTRTQTADGRFTSRACAYRGVAYTAATFEKNDKQIGYNPRMTVVMEGLKCTPLAGGSAVFTRNPAVILYDWYLNVEGYSADQLDLNAFKSLEALCDEVPSGGTLPRYRFDYNFDTNISINDAKKLIWSSFNGRVIKSQGKLKPVWDSGQVADGSGGLTSKTAVHSFTEDNIVRGSLTWSQPQHYNIVRIHYLDGDDDFKKTSVEIKDEHDIDVNGELLFEENCYWITDAEIARRRARFKFNKFQYPDYKAKFTSFSSASDLEVYDLVNITHSLPGWTNKPFLITAKGEDSYGRMQFEVIAYYSGIYDDAEAVDQTNYASDLPNPYDPPSSATGISLSLASPGTGFDYDSVKVSFTTPADPFYSYSEIYISNDDSTYYLAGTSSGEDFVIQGMGMFYVPGDTVYIKLRSVSETGVFGSMSTPESINITSSIRLGSFYAGLHDFWGGNAAIDNAATTIVLGNLDGTPKLALGPSADSLTLNNVDTYKGFYADGDGNFRHGGPSAYGIFDATAGTYTFHGVTISSDVTIEGSGSTANTWTINSDLDDVNAQLILGRTTGGNATIQWNGSELTSNIATDSDGSLQQIVTKEYVDYSVTSLGASYYLVDTSSGVADYKLCSLLPSEDAETYLEAAGLSDNDYIGGWISDTGETPDILLTGNFNFYITAEKTTGTKTLKLYWKMYERKSDTSEVLIATSSITNEVTDKDTFVLPFLLTSDYIPASGSRIVGKIYASVTGGGNAPTVRIYYRGNTSARWDIPANSEVFRSIFVPYANAVQDVDLNGHSITGIDNITVADESWIGIGASDERIVFDTAGNISFMGCKVGVGGTPAKALEVAGDIATARTNKFMFLEVAGGGERASISSGCEGGDIGCNYLHFNVGTSSSGMALTDGNNLGVNTTTPRKQIDSLSTSQAQLRLSYSDNSVYADFQVNSNGNLTVSPTGDYIFDPTGNDVYPNTNYDLNLGLINKKFLTLHAAELWVETLVAQETLATIGGRIVVAPTTTLTSDIGTGDTTIYVKHNNLANGDRIYMEANGKVEFMAVTSSAGGSGPYRGDGFIDIYSLRGIKEASDYGPTIVGNIRNSSTYNDWTEAWAVGNLNGLYGYGNDVYGAAFGKYSAADYITIDPTYGIRFFDSSDVIQAQLKSSEWTIGQVAASKSNIRISSGVLQLRNNTTVKTQLNTDGSGWLAGDGKFNWDTSGNITMTGSITLTNQISSSDISDVDAYTTNQDKQKFSTLIADSPSGSGLFFDSTHFGYYASSAWKTYMDNSGNFYLGGTSGPLQWDAGTSTLTLGVDAFANLPSDENLVGYWAFDDGSGSVAVDGSGNGNDGQLVNMEEADWVDGISGKCLSFDGENEIVDCGTSVGNFLLADFTISVWLKTPSSFNTEQGIIGKWGDPPYYHLAYINGFIKGTLNFGNGVISIGSFSPSVDTQYHVVLNVDRDGLATLYVNADNEGSVDISSDSAISMTNSNRFAIGDIGNAWNKWKGLIDEVRIYNRALTASEVKALYLYPAGNKATKISGSQITTGKIQSTNWVDGTSGSMLDLDNELFAIKDDTFGNSGIQIMWDSGAKFYAGDGSNKYFKFDGTNISWKGVNTELTAAGAFTASNATLTGGTIGGWTISSTTLANGTNIILDASNKKISIKNATFGNEGIQLEYNAGTPRFYVGDGSNEYLKCIQGTGLSLSTAQANAITIKSGGGIKLEAGGDVILTGDSSNPAKTIFSIGAREVELYADSTSHFRITPDANNSVDLLVGSPYTFKDVYLYAAGEIIFRSNVTHCVRPADTNDINFGSESKNWKDAYFAGYVKLGITDTDGTVEGQLWYDASEDKLKFKTASGVETITSA